MRYRLATQAALSPAACKSCCTPKTLAPTQRARRACAPPNATALAGVLYINTNRRDRTGGTLARNPCVEKTRKTHLYPIYLILTDRCSRLTYARLCIPTVLSVCLLSPRPFLTSTFTVPLPYPLCIDPLTPLLTAMYPSCSPHHSRLLVEPLAFGSNSPLFSLRLDDTGPRRPIRLCPYVVRTHVRFRSRVWTRRCPYLCLLYIPVPVRIVRLLTSCICARAIAPTQ